MGRRFWPYSRKKLPKQFLDFFGTGDTLLRITFDRCKGLISPQNIYITTYIDYKDIVKSILPEIDEKQIIIEEERRNTAPSLAYASYLIQKINPDATIVVMPSDQLVLNIDAFREAILKGLDFASEREGDFCKIKTFIEKPALEFAKVFVEGNEFYWNSGIFIWHVTTIMKAFHENMTEVCPRLECDAPDFTACPNISIDYGVMEKADNVYMLCVDFGWADLGTWGSLYDIAPKDEHLNAVLGTQAELYESERNIISLKDKGRLAVIQGINDCIIAESGNVLLICKRENEARIKEFMADIRIEHGKEFL